MSKLSETIKKTTCIWVGHSMIMDQCFGYHHCGRCGELLGDTLGGYFPSGNRAVLIGHNCDKCRENWKNMTWRDKLFVPDPFKEKTMETDRAFDSWLRRILG